MILVLNGMDTMRERSEESERLMDWAFANFEDVTLFAAGRRSGERTGLAWNEPHSAAGRGAKAWC